LEKISTEQTYTRFDWIASIILVLLVLVLSFIYISANLNVTGGPNPVMPLDDTYIHFQYTRVLAEGHPMRYNSDQPPTSGATSLLYPALLLLGYVVGAKGEALGWWALILGIISWIGSALTVYQIAARGGTAGKSVERTRAQRWIGFAATLAFVFTGSLQWAFMSGMETGLTGLFVLVTVWYALDEDFHHTILAGCFTTLMRPEGLIVALVAMLYVLLRNPERTQTIRRIPALAIPIVAALIQPLINLLATGSASASGMIAKSYLYNVPSDVGTMINNVLTTFARMGSELITGYSNDDGPYYLFLLALLTIGAIVIGLVMAWRERRPTPALMLFVIIVGLMLIISTLETAFWQFKRYQQPIIALLFPLMAWALIAAIRYRSRQEVQMLAGLLALIVIASSMFISSFFFANYVGNVIEVTYSQRRMADYVATNVPTGAIVGVHDIGVMRYLGGHTTYDVIGLTTAGAARAWRNGPGSAYEQMRNSPYRPDYFAIYPDARGLTYFADTSLFGEVLEKFPSTQPSRNIASATNSGQNIYKANWTDAQFADQPLQPSSLKAIKDMKLVDSVNVADLASEASHAYRWWEAAKRAGFATELYDMKYVDCAPPKDQPDCRVMDGGRLITSGEEMTVQTAAGQDLIWITRVHGRNPSTLTIYVNGKQIATRLIPAIPGQWLEIATLIPAAEITGTQTRVRVEANITDLNVGHYMPYYHWFYQGTYKSSQESAEILATFGKSIRLVSREIVYNESTRNVDVTLTWRGGESDPVDAAVFIHLYDKDGKLIAQAGDLRPANNTLPPANWLPEMIPDTYHLKLPADLLAGTYQIAIGLYDPVFKGRLAIADGKGDKDNRLFIGSVDVPAAK
jgi:hypothetical protein